MPDADRPPLPEVPARLGSGRRTGVARFTAAVATVGLLLAFIGLALLARTVQTPLQDCGSVYGFLRNGRVDVFGDPANPPAGVTEAEVEATNAKPCRPRVADAARPSAVLIPVGTLVAVAAVITEVIARLGMRRRHRRPPGVAPTTS